jgi:hypothetical protein
MPVKSNKILNNFIRFAFVAMVGFSLYLIYTNYSSFAILKNSNPDTELEIRPQNKTTIIVTSAN